MTSITHSPAWKALVSHQAQLEHASFRDVLADDARRVEAFSLELEGLHADYSRNLATPETLRLLLRLAEEAKLPDSRRQLFEGAPVNNTEGRAALHTLLRTPPGEVPAGLAPQAAEVAETFARMRAFTEQV